jgi:hypothetical protein
MGRYQRGHVFEQPRAFHVRYYTTEVIDGQPKRVQRSEQVCRIVYTTLIALSLH